MLDGRRLVVNYASCSLLAGHIRGLPQESGLSRLTKLLRNRPAPNIDLPPNNEPVI